MEGQAPQDRRPRPSSRRFLKRKYLRLLPWIVVILLSHALVLGISLQRKSYLIDDSVQYLTLAENLVEQGVFSQSYQPPYVPDLQRTPGYPLFLILCLRMPWLVLLLQHLLLLLSGVVLYKLLREYFPRKRSRLVAFLYLLQPYPILFASLILSETLFVTCLLAGLLYVVRYWKTGGRLSLGMGLSLLAVSAYVRPVGLPVLALVVLLIAGKLMVERKGILLRGLMLVLVPLVLVAPWMMRNYGVAGVPMYNSMGDMGMIHGRLGGLEAHRKGEDFHEHRLYMAGDSIVAREIGLENLRWYYGEKENHETELYHKRVKGMTFGYFFQHPGAATVFQVRAIGQMLGGVGFGWANKVLGNETGAYGLAGGQLLFNLLMYIGVLLAMWRVMLRVVKGWQQRRGDNERENKHTGAIQGSFLDLVAIVVILGVLLVSAAAWADGRYRMVVDPLMMLCVAGFLPKSF